MEQLPAGGWSIQVRLTHRPQQDASLALAIEDRSMQRDRRLKR